MSDTDENPATFDLASWVQGVHRNVKTVRVYARPDIEDEVAALRRRLASMRDDGNTERGLADDSPATLRAQIEQLTEALEESGVDFKVEARSSTRLKRVVEAAKADGVEDNKELLLRQLLDQIIKPEGLTIDDLKHLEENLEAQVGKVWNAALEVNNVAPEVTAPFSPGSSAGRSTRKR